MIPMECGNSRQKTMVSFRGCLVLGVWDYLYFIDSVLTLKDAVGGFLVALDLEENRLVCVFHDCLWGVWGIVCFWRWSATQHGWSLFDLLRISAARYSDSYPIVSVAEDEVYRYTIVYLHLWQNGWKWWWLINFRSFPIVLNVFQAGPGGWPWNWALHSFKAGLRSLN